MLKDKLPTTRQNLWVMQRKHDVDLCDTFGLIVKFTSIIVLLAIVAIKNLEIYHVDFQNAFLNGNLDETIFMKQPDGQVFKGEEEFVCKLQKSIWAKIEFKNLILKAR